MTTTYIIVANCSEMSKKVWNSPGFRLIKNVPHRKLTSLYKSWISEISCIFIAKTTRLRDKDTTTTRLQDVTTRLQDITQKKSKKTNNITKVTFN